MKEELNNIETKLYEAIAALPMKVFRGLPLNLYKVSALPHYNDFLIALDALERKGYITKAIDMDYIVVASTEEDNNWFPHMVSPVEV